MTSEAEIRGNEVIAATRLWLERAVIGLNLCPFARAEYVNNRIRYAVSVVPGRAEMRDELAAELRLLADTDPAQCETSLIIYPHALADFYIFLDFVDLAEQLVEELNLSGEIQIANFHPAYQFADAKADAIENYTNRSPHPILHLLRESSIDRAVGAMEDTASIYQNNIQTMRRLGCMGWQRLWQRPDDFS